MFPITVKYKRTLSTDYDKIDNYTILENFRKELEKDGVNYISITNNSIKFKNNLFSIKPGLNWNKWQGIRKGYIEISENNNKREIIYCINTSQIWIVGTIAGLIGLSLAIKGIFIVAFVLFGFLGIFQWLITIIRHSTNLSYILKPLRIYMIK